MKLFKKEIPVEVIHAEFDSAQERVLSECDKLLSELQIPTETKVEKKAQMLNELGFVNSEPVKSLSSFKKQKEEIEKIIDLTKTQALYIRQYMQTYPLEKFITISEFERICNKYNLIHAPVSNYIKDVPEKNVLEMSNRKPLLMGDKIKTTKVITFDLYKWSSSAHINKYVMPNEIKKEHKSFESDQPIMYSWDIDKIIESHLRNKGYIFTKMFRVETKTIETIDKSGLFIAAPASHFNLDGLEKKSKYGFFTVTKREVKDPIVFEYCNGNIVRIITKWGTPDDQSYLDEILLNEKFN